MDETTAKMEQAPRKTLGERFPDLLRTAAGQFRRGEDTAGIEGLIAAVAELEELVETERHSQLDSNDLSGLLPFLRELYFHIHNQDIAGMADFLDDSLGLLTEQWPGGCGDP